MSEPVSLKSELEEHFQAANIPENIRDQVVDVEHYPEELQPYIRAMRYWQLLPPGPKSTQKAKWIKCARELQDACGEFDVEIIAREEFAEWNRVRALGEVPYEVVGPHSLMNTFRSRAGKLRLSAGDPQTFTVAQVQRIVTKAIRDGVSNPISTRSFDHDSVPPEVKALVKRMGGWGVIGSYSWDQIEWKVKKAWEGQLDAE